MKFNVFAGNMYCGSLTVTGDLHFFKPRDRHRSLYGGEDIIRYKQLNLRRIPA